MRNLSRVLWTVKSSVSPASVVNYNYSSHCGKAFVHWLFHECKKQLAFMAAILLLNGTVKNCFDSVVNGDGCRLFVFRLEIVASEHRFTRYQQISSHKSYAIVHWVNGDRECLSRDRARRWRCPISFEEMTLFQRSFEIHGRLVRERTGWEEDWTSRVGVKPDGSVMG
jgi:hypothetical protein